MVAKVAQIRLLIFQHLEIILDIAHVLALAQIVDPQFLFLLQLILVFLFLLTLFCPVQFVIPNLHFIDIMGFSVLFIVEDLFLTVVDVRSTAAGHTMTRNQMILDLGNGQFSNIDLLWVYLKRYRLIMDIYIKKLFELMQTHHFVTLLHVLLTKHTSNRPIEVDSLLFRTETHLQIIRTQVSFLLLVQTHEPIHHLFIALDIELHIS